MAVPSRPVSGQPIETTWGDTVHDTVVALDIQSGVVNVVWAAGVTPTAAAVTFPRAFASAPVVILTPTGSTSAQNVTASTIAVSATGFTCGGREVRETAISLTIPFHWLAIGPRA